MTISTVTSSVNYIGNGVTTSFTFPFVGVTANDITVKLTDNTGTVTTLNPAQYTLVLNPVPVGSLWGVGGSVTYPVSGTPIQVGTDLSIIRTIPYTQIVSIANQGAFYPQAVEQGLDLLELQIQQLLTKSNYSVSAPITDLLPLTPLPSAVDRVNGFLGFDSSGQPVVTFSGFPATGTGVSTRPVLTTGTTIIPVSLGDSYGGISVYQTGPAVTSVQLPATGGPFPVFDGSLNAGTYQITVLPPVGMTILGQSSYLLVFNGQSVTFYNDGIQILVQ